jgi:hypothetical protein
MSRVGQNHIYTYVCACIHMCVRVYICVCGVHTVFLAGKLPITRCIYTVPANPKHECLMYFRCLVRPGFYWHLT